jgi:hypothetical protein
MTYKELVSDSKQNWIIHSIMIDALTLTVDEVIEHKMSRDILISQRLCHSSYSFIRDASVNGSNP